MTDAQKILLRAMRLMAWQRAQGELRACLESLWVEDDTNYDKVKQMIEDFRMSIEEEGYF